MDTAITALLRVGVLLSVAVIATGMVITLVQSPASFSTRVAAFFPRTIGEVVDGVRHGSGLAIMTTGLLLLIATPVARVALSVVIFVIVRDKLYVAITTAVFIILMIAFAVGRAAG